MHPFFGAVSNSIRSLLSRTFYKVVRQLTSADREKP